MDLPKIVFFYPPPKWMEFISWFQPYEQNRFIISHYNIGVSKNTGTPKWTVKIMENTMNKWMICGGNHPLFLVQHPVVGLGCWGYQLFTTISFG